MRPLLFALLACLASPAAAGEAPFAPGEVLSYNLLYNGLGGGSSTQSVLAVENLNGRKTFHLAAETKTNKTFDRIHKIRERRDSWLDVEKMSSVKLTESLTQGGYQKKSTTTVDPATGRMHHIYKTNKHQGETGGTAPAGVQDTLSVVYYLRTIPLKVGEVHELTVHSGGELHKTRIEVRGIETVEVSAGKFRAYRLSPALAGGEKPKISLEVWLSDDARRLPVLIKSKIESGTITVRLKKPVPQ